MYINQTRTQGQALKVKMLSGKFVFMILIFLLKIYNNIHFINKLFSIYLNKKQD